MSDTSKENVPLDSQFSEKLSSSPPTTQIKSRAREKLLSLVICFEDIGAVDPLVDTHGMQDSVDARVCLLA
ncbi:hypothetical protein Sjap_013579 [Stephania japonica]|uniref:Uncharacterized protein n=1 Tax=Stephania japonica TaxID=461633 RepID=A0AAP0J059_9MAGN